MFRKNKKKFVYYGVKLKSNPLIILTVVPTKEDAQEYINKLLYLQHKDEFDTWCYYRQIDEKNKQLYWPEYFNTRITAEEKSEYMFYKIKYSFCELAGILRMFCGCKPIGCSYELKDELAYLETKTRIRDRLNKNLDYLHCPNELSWTVKTKCK